MPSCIRCEESHKCFARSSDPKNIESIVSFASIGLSNLLSLLLSINTSLSDKSGPHYLKNAFIRCFKTL